MITQHEAKHAAEAGSAIAVVAVPSRHRRRNKTMTRIAMIQDQAHDVIASTNTPGGTVMDTSAVSPMWLIGSGPSSGL